MRKLFGIVVIGLLTGCSPDHSTIGKSEKMIIYSIEDKGEGSYGRYRIKFDHVDLVIQTDSLYSIGDELVIIKK